MSTQECTHGSGTDYQEYVFKDAETGESFFGWYQLCSTCREQVESGSETFEEMQENLLIDLKDSGVPRELWETLSEAADRITDLAQFVDFRKTTIARFGY